MILCHESMESILVIIVSFIFIAVQVHSTTITAGVSTIQATTTIPGVCNVYRKVDKGGLYVNLMVEICCNHFYKSNGVCVECPVGFYSKGEVCEKCKNGHFGKKCGWRCSCNSLERCDHVTGCVPIDDKTETGVTVTNDKGSYNDVREAVNNNVVTYMTCVAVGSVLVVVCGLIVKNREAMCQKKPITKTMKSEIKKRKWSKFNFGKANVKKESLYADINEKYMLNFDGE